MTATTATEAALRLPALTESERLLLARGPLAVIDLDALAANYRQLQRQSAPAACAPVIKCDGYGLGIAEAGSALAGAGAALFFVARLDDGIRLRQAVPDAEIAVLDGIAEAHVREAEQLRLMPGLSSAESIRSWFAVPRTVAACIQIDTGMSRLGLRPGEAPGLNGVLNGLPAGAVRLHMTHLISAGDGDHALCEAQTERFLAAIAGWPRAPRSIVNSAGLYLDRAWHCDITRPGKALHGITPLAPGLPNPLRPVLSVLAPILQIRDVQLGETAGYSATWRSARPARIATVGIGYGNGYLRSLSNRGIAVIGGQRVPVVGRVSMDLITLDVTDVPGPLLAEGFAEMLGPGMDVTELSALAGSNEHEMQIALAHGCHRVYRAASTAPSALT